MHFHTPGFYFEPWSPHLYQHDRHARIRRTQGKSHMVLNVPQKSSSALRETISKASLTPALELFPHSQRSSELICTGKTPHLWRRLSDIRSALIPGSQLHDSPSRSLTSTVPTGPFQRLLNHRSPLHVRVPPLRIPSMLCLQWGSASGHPRAWLPSPQGPQASPPLPKPRRPLPPSGPPRSRRAEHGEQPHGSNLTCPLTS